MREINLERPWQTEIPAKSWFMRSELGWENRSSGEFVIESFLVIDIKFPG